MKNVTLPFFLLLCVFAHAQDSARYRPFSVQLNVTSVPVQQVVGTDTSFDNALSLSPVLELRSKSGWGIAYSPSFVNSTLSSGLYMQTIAAGYEKYGGKNFDLAFSYNHFFFTYTTAVPYSPLTNDASIFINYTHSWIRPLIAISAGFGKDSATGAAAHDIALSAGINHSFSWEGKGIFSEIELVPSVLINGGSEGYFSFLPANKYVSHSSKFIHLLRKAAKGRSGSGRGIGNSKSNAGNAPFALSNLEGGAEASFEIGAFTVRSAGSIFLPVGTLSDNTLCSYGQISLQYRF